MTYKTVPRTRQAVYGMTFIFGGVLLFFSAWRWTQTQERIHAILGLWVLGVAWATVRILRGLEKLEEQRSEPDASMELLFYAASILPIAGYAPLLLVLGQR